MADSCGIDIGHWLEVYKAGHRELLEADPEFANWLETEYRPLAGGWQY